MLRRYGRACGIDITWSGLPTRRRGRAPGRTRVRDPLPFPAGQFDLVTSFDVLYAFDDEMERDALNEMYRVLRPGGQIIVNVAALKFAARQPFRARRRGPPLHRAELRDHLTRTGFTVSASPTRTRFCPSSPASGSLSAWPGTTNRTPR